MPEIRIDPLTGRRVVIAPERADRPGGGLTLPPTPRLDPASDPFAPGHESMTAPEVFALRPGDTAPDTPGWTVRVVPNRYPLLVPDAPDPEPEANRDLYWSQAARGSHEVIVNAPEPVVSLADLEVAQLIAAVEVWRGRMRAHGDAACLHLLVNEAAGASQPHTHAQLLALDFVPADLARERERFGAYATRTMGANLLSDLVQQEVRRRERVVAIDADAVLLSAYGGRVPYQMMLAPRSPRMRFEEDGPTGAALLHDGLNRLRHVLGGSPPLNLWIRTAPRGAEYYCWRIDILPRLFGLGGTELGTGIDVNPVSPEAAAARAARRLMRALVQRVRSASVEIAGQPVSAIGPGLLVLLGVTQSDTEAEADWIADKVRALRVFPDAEGRMNEPLGDREVLCVSQFTLYGDTRKGNRPSYVHAAPGELAEPLYVRVCERLQAKRGVFGADMQVALVNDGPVTLLLESR